MKKIFLFAVVSSIALSAFAQKSKSNIKMQALRADDINVAARTTAVGDTGVAQHIFSTDTVTAYHVGGADSGYVGGTDAYGDQGFAERYVAGDSLLSVIGVIAKFTGTVNPSSTKNIVFNTWSVGPQTVWSDIASGHVYNSGFPNTSLASLTVPITHIGIGTTADTQKTYYFPTATAPLSKFFVGYTIAYNYAALAGDTISVLMSKDGERHITYSTVSGADTIINNVNATMYSDNTWHDDAFDNFQLGNHLYIFPIVRLGLPNGVQGVTKNNFTFFGNYPNPATTATNIKFSIAQATTVTITISDVSGRVVKTISDKYAAGTQIVPVNTDAMPAGEYVYLVQTAEGEGFASKMSIIK